MGIDAALKPADVDYMFFVARPDGSHIFTRTLDEHNRARVARAVRDMQQAGGEAPPPGGSRPHAGPTAPAAPTQPPLTVSAARPPPHRHHRPRLAAPRSVIEVVAAALSAGAPAIQLRDKTRPQRELFEPGTRTAARCPRRRTALHQRPLDVALAAGADGVHLGPDDLPVAAARRIAPPGFLIGYSTDDPDSRTAGELRGRRLLHRLRRRVRHDDQAELGDERIGLERLDEVARAVDIPVVGIGGITTDNVAGVAATGAAGAAVGRRGHGREPRRHGRPGSARRPARRRDAVVCAARHAGIAMMQDGPTLAGQRGREVRGANAAKP
jgi:thiamine-phosphate pyrophosphorylase